jgi:acyl-coenzyme A synthetase/AMP-(fatty) acid ligase
MRLDNTVEFPITYLAALAVDLVPVPTSAQLTAPEVGKLIDQLEPALIVHDPAVPCPVGDIPTISPLDIQSFKNLTQADFVFGDPNRLGYIVFTSGTSGSPRGVMHAHRAIWARQMMFKDWYDLHSTDRLMHAGAFNWTFTLGTGLMDPWTVGASSIIPAKGVPIEALPLLLNRHEATIFAAAPGVYRKILKEHQTLPLKHLRHGIAAGEKLAPTVAQAWNEATGKEVYEAFGMSECSTFISGCPSHPAPNTALGFAQNGRKVAVISKDIGAPVPFGTEGILAIDKNDPGLMLGYLNNPEATAAAFKDTWFLTGDMGTMDADGAITYLGRGDDMMNAGGFRVSPLEVEQALGGLEGISALAVTAIKVGVDVSVIGCFYSSERALDENHLLGCAAERLAQYKRPKFFMRVDALPLGPNGKLNRRALQSVYEAQNGKT